jgi:predicted ATPase
VRELPRGTVTFLFTDIEGSTRLLHELGAEDYASRLAEHRRVLRTAFERHGGVEVDTQGDAFFVAFPTAPGALAAAREAQRELELPVRMGLHTGTPLLTSEGYVGADVHRAARIAAAGHGGQVLVSPTTAAAVDGELRELGEHRLKDFDEPVALFQLGVDRFPPLKTIANTNLPRPASSFVGREREVAEIARLVRANRMVTLTGPGGTGKTRLAIEGAGELVGELAAGVFWIGLASLRDPELVVQTIAQTLGAKEGLAAHIGEREQLILLDNLEQVIGAAPELAALVEACPNLRLLVTSRELLHVRGEVEYEVLPLAEPDAVALFCARAHVEPGPVVVELCRRLDNLPLALELAAARVKVLAPDQILDRLSQRLDLLKGGRDADPRQQTLRATIAWSHDLLDEHEQRLFRRLAVFAGGCTLEAEEEILEADLDTLQSLVEKSLVRFTGGRYWMLETIREFAAERLDESGEAENLHERLSDYLLALPPPWRTTRTGLADVVDRLGAELPNYRAAFTWALEAEPRRCLELATALGRFWVIRDPAEGDRWLTEALSRTPEQPPELRADALLWAASCRSFLPDRTGVEAMLEESLSLFRALGNAGRVGDALDRLAGARATAGNLQAAKAAAEESLALFEQLGEPDGAMYVLDKVATIALQEGDRKTAREAVERALSLAREYGDSWWAVGSMNNLAEWALEEGDLAQAAELGGESAHMAAQLGDRRHLAEAFCVLAAAAAAGGESAVAGRFWGALEALEREGDWVEAEFRAAHSARVELAEGADFAAAAEAVRLLAVDEAVRAALAAID